MSAKRGIRWSILAGALAVAAVLIALHAEQRLESLETSILHRAPTARPLPQRTANLERIAAGATVYLPVYSHVYSRGGKETLLEVTLSIRNTDPALSIVVEALHYYDNDGHLLREYLDAPVVLEPLASIDFLVSRQDRAGGVGANFLIDWVAEEPVSEPLFEAVMVSSEGNQAFSFVRSGRTLARRSPKEAGEDAEEKAEQESGDEGADP